ncbi:hypothetical protein F4805DRAFT_295463 [Annulohypoxylon moriforme]|nr:hypothetical protein F4805DRAFT_295463 [Annulohypoxylon moriforme]
MMLTKPPRHFIRLPLYLPPQPATRSATNIIRHGPRTPHFRPLSYTPRSPRNPTAKKTFMGPLFKYSIPQLTNKTPIRFSKTEIPPLSFWEAYAQPPLVPPETVTPEACRDACERYVTLAPEGGTGWRNHLPPLLTLYYTSVVLLNSPGNTTTLAVHMLQTGAALKYGPSILTTMRIAYKLDKSDDHRFAKASEGLAVLCSGKGQYRPDALTLSGLIASSTQSPKDDVRALKLFKEAAAAFSANPSSLWQWRISAVLEKSKIYVRQKQPDLARAVLKENVSELDNADVLYAYAMLLPDSDPERVSMLERAAISASSAAAQEMGRIEQERASEPGLSDRERHDRRVLADEWFRIAGG